MKIRGLLIASLVLVGLFGLVYWSNEAEKAKEGEPDPDAPPRIVDVEEDTIVRLAIQPKGGDALVLEKGENGEWRITAPEPLRADSGPAGQLVSAVAELESDRLVEESATDLSVYGLNAPQLVVVATQKDGGELQVLVGDETPTGSNYFAKLESDPRIFTMASFNKSSLEKTPWDLRDKRLLTFDSGTLSRVELTAQGSTFEIGRNAQNNWQIVEPKPMRADGGSVEQLISRLHDAKMDAEQTEDEMKKAIAAFGKANRVALVNVSDAAGTQTLEVRKAVLGDYYAKSDIVDGVFKITSAVGDGLDKGLSDFRNKKLFDFGFNEPNRIQIRHDDKTSTYKKSEEKWLRDGTEMDSVKVRALIDELRDLSAEAFPDSGFTEAYFEATVATADGETQEKVLISKTGEKYFAKRENEPSIYALKAVDVDRLESIAADIKEPAEVSAEEDAEE